MRTLLAMFVVLCLAAVAHAATIESAKLAADSGDYQTAISHYQELLKAEWPEATLASIVDGYTDSLAKAGNYATAVTQLNDFLAKYPDDSIADKLSVRRATMTYQQKDYANTVRLSKEFLAKYSTQGTYAPQIQGLLIDGLMGSKGYQELVTYVDQTLKDNPSHVNYALFRQKQGDAMADGLKQYEQAHLQFKDAVAHTSTDSGVHDYCFFRSGGVLMTEAKGIMSKDPKLYDDVTSRGMQIMRQYLALASKDKLYPDNVRRRLKAHIYLKQYDQMEAEATAYCTDIQHITPLEKMKTMYMVGVARSFGVAQAKREDANKDLRGALKAFDAVLATECDDKSEQNYFWMLSAKRGINIAHEIGDLTLAKPYIIFIRDKLPESKDRTQVLSMYGNILDMK